MVTSTDGGLAALLREGDYFILKAVAVGVEVEYAPDGSRGGPINGAFAAIKGQIKVWNPTEAAEIFQDKGADAENFLLRDLRRTMEDGIKAQAGPEPAEKLGEKLHRLLKGFAEEYAGAMQGYWRGYLPDFHREFVSKVYPGALDRATIAQIRKLDQGLAGIWIESQGKTFRDTYITVDWEAMAQG
jgi:hypothetical protein